MRKSNAAGRSKSGAMSAGEELGQKLLKSAREMNAGKAARVTRIEPNEIADARQRPGLSRRSLRLRSGYRSERCRSGSKDGRSPSGAARTLIRIAKSHPAVVREALAAS